MERRNTAQHAPIIKNTPGNRQKMAASDGISGEVQHVTAHAASS